MSFITDFFGADGAGTSAVGSLGQIGIGFVNNNGKQIEADYATELQKLKNENAVGSEQYQLAKAKLDAQYANDGAAANDAKRSDTLRLVGVIGGFVLIGIVAVLLILKRSNP